MYRAVRKIEPAVVVIDPITNLMTVGSQTDVRAMLTRMIDFLKTQSITAVFTSLTANSAEFDGTEEGISSLMDTWIALTVGEENQERHRWVRILKSRGMAHSNFVREFALTDHGFSVLDTRAAQRERAAPRGR